MTSLMMSCRNRTSASEAVLLSPYCRDSDMRLTPRLASGYGGQRPSAYAAALMMSSHGRHDDASATKPVLISENTTAARYIFTIFPQQRV